MRFFKTVVVFAIAEAAVVCIITKLLRVDLKVELIDPESNKY